MTLDKEETRVYQKNKESKLSEEINRKKSAGMLEKGTRVKVVSLL